MGETPFSGTGDTPFSGTGEILFSMYTPPYGRVSVGLAECSRLAHLVDSDVSPDVDPGGSANDLPPALCGASKASLASSLN